MAIVRSLMSTEKWKSHIERAEILSKKKSEPQASLKSNDKLNVDLYFNFLILLGVIGQPDFWVFYIFFSSLFSSRRALFIDT